MSLNTCSHLNFRISTEYASSHCEHWKAFKPMLHKTLQIRASSSTIPTFHFPRNLLANARTVSLYFKVDQPKSSTEAWANKWKCMLRFPMCSMPNEAGMNYRSDAILEVRQTALETKRSTHLKRGFWIYCFHASEVGTASKCRCFLKN